MLKPNTELNELIKFFSLIFPILIKIQRNAKKKYMTGNINKLSFLIVIVNIKKYQMKMQLQKKLR